MASVQAVSVGIRGMTSITLDYSWITGHNWGWGSQGRSWGRGGGQKALGG